MWDAMRSFYEGVDIPTVLYRAETWQVRKILNVLEMRCVRCTAGVTRLDIIRNGIVQSPTVVINELFAAVHTQVLRRFEHMKSID